MITVATVSYRYYSMIREQKTYDLSLLLNAEVHDKMKEVEKAIQRQEETYNDKQ